YTGCSAQAILLTTDKVVSKKILKSAMIPTPEWLTCQEDKGFMQGERYILKPVDEDGSVHITEESVIKGESLEGVQERLQHLMRKTNKAFFAERYIEGRELNISMIGNHGHPEVLPAAEIRYIGFKERDKLEILDYKAKWAEESFEFKNTVPNHDFHPEDGKMLKLLEECSKKCWYEFGLKGYARVDYRVDREGNPWVLEVNANPCITLGASGFIRSAALAGLTYTQIIERLIDEALRKA
ncbi:MAG TPA: D-alanine--D-alanine ligase, partial [Clostridiales bacterium]|nr:D-alanine--D-alanine ligase [Clostridiales bacterium]